MKIVIFYYSSTGNTRLVCQCLARRIKDVEFDLIDIAGGNKVCVDDYDVIGLVAPTFHLDVPPLMEHFIQQLPLQSNKPAFVLNTYGAMSGRTLKNLAKLATIRGFNVIAGHSVLTPENYPPFILKGWGNENAPNDEEMEKFEQFIAQLNERLTAIRSGQTVVPAKIKNGFFNSLLRPAYEAKSKKKMGELLLDESACTACGICADGCPYRAVTLNSKPVFNTARCRGCWTCFNHCPEQAIYTAKIRGEGHYPQPLPEFVAKMEA